MGIDLGQRIGLVTIYEERPTSVSQAKSHKSISFGPSNALGSFAITKHVHISDA